MVTYLQKDSNLQKVTNYTKVTKLQKVTNFKKVSTQLRTLQKTLRNAIHDVWLSILRIDSLESLSKGQIREKLIASLAHALGE
jgi:hypothetical protein